MFLDINMPRLRGTDFLKALPNPPKVIFTTAHRDYALEGFELGVVDYLLKPYSLERFLLAVNRAMNVTQKAPLQPPAMVTTTSERFIYVRADRKMVKIMVDDILYIESLKDYVRIVLNDRQVITKQTITALEEMLPAQHFMRIHRSIIAAIAKIDSYHQHAVFIGRLELPIGPLYKHDITRKLTQRT
jgi:DNA-binding LytR/AlgR family response regulator